MAKLTLSAPLVVNPQEAADIKIHHTFLDFDRNAVTVRYSLLDAQGQSLSTRTVEITGVATYLSNQETNAYNYLKSKLGVSGTVQ